MSDTKQQETPAEKQSDNSARINTGGAAFPRQAAQTEAGIAAGNKGMSLRDYFIAHAPHAIPDEYQPTILGHDGPDATSRPMNGLERALSWPSFWADEQISLRSKLVRAR